MTINRIIRGILAAGVALALSGCALAPALLGSLLTGGPPAPAGVQAVAAPLARTTFDESAYRTALAGANTLRLSINVLVARKLITPSSPSALRLADGLEALRDGLKAARALLDALNDPLANLSPAELAAKAAEYRKAMAAAQAAAESIGEAMTGLRADAANLAPARKALAMVRASTARGAS